MESSEEKNMRKAYTAPWTKIIQVKTEYSLLTSAPTAMLPNGNGTEISSADLDGWKV